MLPLMLEPFSLTFSCFFQGTTSLPDIISLQKLLFLLAPVSFSLMELQIRSWQPKTEGKKVRNTGQGEEVHLSPGFGQTDLHNRARQLPPTAASVVCATSLWRKAFSFLAIFSVGSMQLELYTGIPQM